MPTEPVQKLAEKYVRVTPTRPGQRFKVNIHVLVDTNSPDGEMFWPMTMALRDGVDAEFAAEEIRRAVRLAAIEYAASEVAILEEQLARLSRNDKVADCSICGRSIWEKQERIEESGKWYHPICKAVEIAVAGERERWQQELRVKDAEIHRLKTTPNCSYGLGDSD